MAIYPVSRILSVRDPLGDGHPCSMCGTRNARFRTRCTRCNNMI